MNASDPRHLLDRHSARVLTRWREHLRALPPSSALATPELLTPLMAPALARVRHETTRAVPDIPSETAPCRCGLNPLVTFYLTGECATFDVLWSQPDALAPLPRLERESVCHVFTQAWRRVAAEEIALFCSVCQRGAARAAEDAAEESKARTGAAGCSPQGALHSHAPHSHPHAADAS